MTFTIREIDNIQVTREELDEKEEGNIALIFVLILAFI